MLWKNAAGSKILIMWEQLLQAFEESCTDTHTFTGFLEQGQKALRYYYDILVFQETYYDGRLEAMEKIVIGVLNSVKLMKISTCRSTVPMYWQECWFLHRKTPPHCISGNRIIRRKYSAV